MQIEAGEETVDPDPLGVQGLGVVRGGPFCELLLVGNPLPLDVESGQAAIQPCRQPPGLVTEQAHDCRDEGHSHQEGVGEDADGQGQGDLLDGVHTLWDEEDEDRDHDDSGCRDDLARTDESPDHRTLGVTGVDVLLAHSRHQEDLVVHGQAEEDAHDDDRHEGDDRDRTVEVDHGQADASVENQLRGSEGGQHREQVTDGCLDGDRDRPKHHRQQHQAQPDDEDSKRQQGGSQTVGDVELDGRQSGDGGVNPVLVVPFGLVVAQFANQVTGRLVGGTGGRQHLDHSCVGVLVRNGQGDGVDARKLLDVSLEPVDDLHRGGRGDDVGGDDDRAVESWSELLLQGVIGLTGGVVGGQFRGGGQAEVEVLHRNGQGPQPHHDDEDGHQWDAGDGAHPPPEDPAGAFSLANRSGAGRRCVPTSCGIVVTVRPGCHRSWLRPPSATRFPRAQSLSHEPHEGRQHCQGDDNRQSDTDGSEDAHDGEEGNVGDGQANEGDEDRRPGEHHCRTRGRNGSGGRFLHLKAVTQLVAVTRQNEQGVVDPNGQPQHDGKHRCD